MYGLFELFPYVYLLLHFPILFKQLVVNTFTQLNDELRKEFSHLPILRYLISKSMYLLRRCLHQSISLTASEIGIKDQLRFSIIFRICSNS